MVKDLTGHLPLVGEFAQRFDLRGVLPLEVQFQAAPPGEPPTTELTVVRLHSGVHREVLLHVALLTKPLPAGWTLVRLLVGVGGHVLLQTAPLGETFAANNAGERLALGVDLEARGEIRLDQIRSDGARATTPQARSLTLEM